MEIPFFARDGLRKEKKTSKTPYSNVDVMSQMKKIATENKHSLPGVDCTCL